MADSLVWVSAAPRQVSSLPYISEATRAEFNYYLSQASEIINTGLYPTHEVIRHGRFISAIAGREIAPEPPRVSWRNDPPPIPRGAPYVVLDPGSNEPGRRRRRDRAFRAGDHARQRPYPLWRRRRRPGAGVPGNGGFAVTGWLVGARGMDRAVACRLPMPHSTIGRIIPHVPSDRFA